MNPDLTHGTSSLKELVGVAVLQTDFPSAGRSTRVGISPPPWKLRWGHPGRRVRTRISFPLRLPSMFGERAVLLSPLVGCSWHAVYGPCLPPSIHTIVSLTVSDVSSDFGSTVAIAILAFTRNRSFKDRVRCLSSFGSRRLDAGASLSLIIRFRVALSNDTLPLRSH
jgi:hypothetical protein